MNTTDASVVKNKYLKSMMGYLDFKCLGTAFWGSTLFALTNKNDPASKVIYAFEMENGSKIELVNIYDGSACRINNYHRMTFNIKDGTNYQRDMVLDLVFACFVYGISVSEKTKGVVYNYHKNNITKPQDAMFKIGDFELYVQHDRVELFIPNFDNKIIGHYKKLPMIDAPNIQWEIGNNKKPFFLMGDEEYFD